MGIAAPDGEETIFEPLVVRGQIDHASIGGLQQEIVQKHALGGPVMGDFQLMGLLGDHRKAEIFEDRHAPAQRDRHIPLIKHDAQLMRRCFCIAEQMDCNRHLRR